MKYIWLFLLVASAAMGDTSVFFRPDSASQGPFPSDSFTVSDPTQKTGLRVNLPVPLGCTPTSTLGNCVNWAIINQFDGFNPNARINVCFSKPIDPSTAPGAIWIAPVSGGPKVGIDQITYDPAGNCLYAKPSVVLKEDTRYLLAVTKSLTDTKAKPVIAEGAFTSCLASGKGDYCEALQDAIGKKTDSIVSASLFTTMSVSDWMQKARDAVNNATPELVVPAGFPFVLPLAGVSSMTWNVDTGTGVSPQPLPTSIPGVESIAFGLYLSPSYLATSASGLTLPGTIPFTPTNRGIASQTGLVPVSFHVFLPPASKMPEGGFPVVIYGHGLGDNQFGAPTTMASTLAQNGFATVAIEVTGHGFGPKSTVQVTDGQGVHTMQTPGRGVQLNPASPIGPLDGCIAPGPYGIRDCVRQTAVDLMQFTRTLNDFWGFGLGLNPARVYYVGQSFGSIYGTILQAMEPRIGAAVINGGGGPQTDIARLAISGRLLGDAYLQYMDPGGSYFNVLAGKAPPAPYYWRIGDDKFNEQYPFRGQITTATVTGALNIQGAFEQAEWIVMSGDALPFGPLLQGKRTAFQFGIGDLEVPNPTESALVRAANGVANTSIFRTDALITADPAMLGIIMPGFPLPVVPHRILSNPTILSYPDERSVALAEQQQAVTFFQQNGAKPFPDANQFLTPPFQGQPLFAIPTSDTLPNTLNFIQFQP